MTYVRSDCGRPREPQQSLAAGHRLLGCVARAANWASTPRGSVAVANANNEGVAAGVDDRFVAIIPADSVMPATSPVNHLDYFTGLPSAAYFARLDNDVISDMSIHAAPPSRLRRPLTTW
jgi:hypothetical protein